MKTNKPAPDIAEVPPAVPTEVDLKKGTELVYQKDKIESITGTNCVTHNSDEIVLASKVARYIEDMNPNVMVNEKTGANRQLELYHVLNKIMGYKPARFKILYRWFLKTIEVSRKSKGAFNDRYVMRFHSWMNLSTTELALYRRLLNLAVVTADLKLKDEVVKRVDIRSITETIKDRTTRDNILTFYFNR